MSDALYAHYYVRGDADCPSGEVYVKVFGFDDTGRATVLNGARIAPADDLGDDTGTFEFLALVREEDLIPGIQTQGHVVFSFTEAGR